MFGVQPYWKAPVTHTHTLPASSETTYSSEQRQTEGRASPQRKNGSNSTADRKTQGSGVELRNWCQLWLTIPTQPPSPLHSQRKIKKRRKCLFSVCFITGWWYQAFLPCSGPVTAATTVWHFRHWVTPLLSYAWSRLQVVGISNSVFNQAKQTRHLQSTLLHQHRDPV